MKNVLNTEKFERAINECDGSLAIGVENAKMMLELAKTERSFSMFVDFLGKSEETENAVREFERLRDKCAIEALKKMMG